MNNTILLFISYILSIMNPQLTKLINVTQGVTQLTHSQEILRKL